MTTRISFAPGLALLCGLTAAGQKPIDPPLPVKVVKGLPYSYQLVSASRWISLDGTAVMYPTTIKVFRDAAGRTRTERPIVTSFPARPDDSAIVEIYDVIAGYRYILDTANKVAHRSAIPKHPKPPERVIRFPTSNIASAQATSSPGGHNTASSAFSLALPSGSCDGCTLSDPGPIANGTGPWPGHPNAVDARPEPKGKSLGTRVIEGLKCEGRLVKDSSEIWTSKELRIVVLAKIRDARGEVRLEYIKNFSRLEPELPLFQPPPDYKLVDQSGPFTITIPIR